MSVLKTNLIGILTHENDLETLDGVGFDSCH